MFENQSNESGGTPAADSGITYTSTSDPEHNTNPEKVVPDNAGKEVQENHASTGEQPGEESSKSVPKKKPGGFQKKIDRLNNTNAELLARIAALEGNKVEKPIDPKAEKKAKAPAEVDPNAPKIEDYENAIDFLTAHNEYTAEKAVKNYEKSKTEAATKEAAEKIYSEKQDKFDEQLEPLLQVEPKFVERAAELYKAGMVTPQLEDAILDSPIGPQITLHLMNNPEELKIIKGMSREHTYRAIALLEASLGTPGVKQQPIAAVKQTNAAPPIKPIGKQASTAAKRPEDMDQEEYEAWRFGSRTQ